MPINNNLESLRLRALSHFSPNATFLQRTLARIPVFFIGLTAFFNEALLGLKSILFKAIPLNKGDAKSQETTKTEKVSLQIFKLLWKTPSNDDVLFAKSKVLSPLIKDKDPTSDDVLFAKAAVAISQHPMFSQNPPPLTSPYAHFLQYDQFNPATIIIESDKIVSCLDFLQTHQITSTTLVDYVLNKKNESQQSSNHNFTLIEQAPNSQTLIEQLNQVVLDLNHLTTPVPQKLKDYLERHCRTNTFNLTLIHQIHNPEVKKQLLQIFYDHIGSIDALKKDTALKKEACQAYQDYFASKSKPPYLSYELIAEFAASLKDIPQSKITSYTHHLKKILQFFALQQLSLDINRTKVSIAIPDYRRFNLSQEKGFIDTSFWEKNNSTVPILIVYDYFYHLQKYYESTLHLSFDEAQRQALILMFGLSQAFDSILTVNTMNEMGPFIEKLITNQMLPDTISFMQGGSSSSDLHIQDKNHIAMINSQPVIEKEVVRTITLQDNGQSFQIPYRAVYTATIKGPHIVFTFKENKILYDKIQQIL